MNKVRIDLITKKVKVNGSPLNHRYFYIYGNYPVLIFADSISKSLFNDIQKISKDSDFAVVVITLDTRVPINKPNISIINVSDLWYIHTLFIDPFTFKMVYGEGKGRILANAFSQFTGLRIHLLGTLLEAIDLKKIINSSILIKTYDGIGDLLMCTPTAKTYHSKGFNVDFLVWPGREDVIQNLPYIRRIYTDPKNVNLLYYKRFYDVSYKLSDYSSAVCRQHRVYATANMCGLENKELVTNKPEIILTPQEISKAKKILRDIKSPRLLITFESFDIRRSYPADLQQPLINLLSKHFNIIITGYNKKRYYNCLNLTGLLDIRTFFAVVNSVDLVLTVDTSTLHVAAAFNKPTVFLPSTIPYEWRAYDNTVSLVPSVSCYPCLERIDVNKSECMNNNYQNCLHTISFDSILKALFKVFKLKC